jgi:GntR family transcriptional regulator/MocR family aminotransferase
MARTRSSSTADLLVELRRDDPLPLHCQVERQIRTAIRAGRLLPGAALPSTRHLARQLELSRGVVVEAYEQLVAEGYLTSQPGASTRVCSSVAEAAPAGPTLPAQIQHRIDFAYGRPDVTQFPRQVWLRALRRVLNTTPSDRLSYLDNRGAVELRDALAEYLNRVRGTAAHPDRIVICNGFAQAMDIVAQLVRAIGGRRIAVEDPGHRDATAAAARYGLGTVAIPVDEAGIVVGALADTDADAVSTTPAHHFPTGAVLSAERRAELVAWAVAGNRLVLEDDYDAEFRYDREPIGALHGLAPEHVIYAGSASKTLAPGLRLGWLVVPAHLVEAAAAIKEANDRGSPGLEQLAFADFLARGEFDHHLRRMRPIYRARRDVLLAALARHTPDLRPTGASAGLHVVAWLPDGIDEVSIVERAAAVGVGINGIGPYRMTSAPARGGLLFGYGGVREDQIDEGIRLVGDAIGSARAGRGSVAGERHGRGVAEAGTLVATGTN